VVLLTLTAPGADALPWDREHCRPLGEHACSGELGCRVQQPVADAWNEDCANRWRRLHRRVYQDVKKRAPELYMLTRVFELQLRGVLHVHPVLAFGTPGQKAAAHFYLRRLVQLAPAYGFGFADRKLEPIVASAAAAYLSSYFVTGKKEKVALHESVSSPAMPQSIIWVSPRLTQVTGCTMRELRYRRFVWRCAGGFVDIGYIKTARCIAQAYAYYGGPPPFRIVLKILHRRLDDEPPS
jgi:hypothetical protein